MQVGALPLWKLILRGANRLLQQGACTHRQSTMDIVDAHQGKSAEQCLTDLHNKCSGGFDMTAPHEIAVASFQELMHAHS